MNCVSLAHYAFALSLMMALLAVTATARAADVKTSDPFPDAKRATIDDALAKAFGAAKVPGVVVGIDCAGCRLFAHK